MKAFNGFLFSNLKKFSPEMTRSLVKNYYAEVGSLIIPLMNDLNNLNFRDRFGAETTNNKLINFMDSIVIHDEMFNNLKTILEKNLLSAEEIRSLMEKYFEFLLKIKLKESKKVMHKTYFVNLLQITSKFLNFFSIVLFNKKENSTAENEFLKNVALIFDSKPSRIDDLVRFAIEFLTSIPMEYTKFKVDAFGFVRNFCDNHSDAIIDNIERLLSDDFFLNRSKIKFSELEINRIYYYWISSHKILIRTFKKTIQMRLKMEDIFLMIENNIHILFEENN